MALHAYARSSPSSRDRLTIGIIGGGQLGLFLCRAARDLGLRTVVLTPDRQAPAAAAADDLLIGSLDDVDAAIELAGQADVITFEIEAVGVRVLEQLAACAARGRVRVAPAPDIMLTLQNKVLQKTWLRREGFPTAEFVVLDDAPARVPLLAAGLGFPLVQKAATHGYDGRGVQILATPEDLSRLWPGPGVLEAYVGGAREVAVLAARDLAGRVSVYPVVDLSMDSDAHVLEFASAPAALPPQLTTQAQDLAGRVVTRLGGVGLFAVEMFVTGEQELLINEISPRVHNAGHFTLEACATSQFEQHLRAVAGLPLGDTSQRSPAVMRNLLAAGGPEQALPVAPLHLALDTGSLAVHWYGKPGNRVGRKLGHVTALGDNLDDARGRCQQAGSITSRLARGLPA